MIATYGLRPHEALHLEGPPDEDALVTVLPETKTGFHVSHPAPEEWIDRWSLRQMRLPAIRSDRANNLVGQAVSTQCSRLSPPLAVDGRRLSPDDLRHCWARRVHCSPDLIPFWTTADAAESLGHSEAVHRQELASVSGNPSIDIGENWGTSELSGDDLEIAAGKGWTVLY